MATANFTMWALEVFANHVSNQPLPSPLSPSPLSPSPLSPPPPPLPSPLFPFFFTALGHDDVCITEAADWIQRHCIVPTSGGCKQAPVLVMCAISCRGCANICIYGCVLLLTAMKQRSPKPLNQVNTELSRGIDDMTLLKPFFSAMQAIGKKLCPNRS